MLNEKTVGKIEAGNAAAAPTEEPVSPEDPPAANEAQDQQEDTRF